MTERVQVDPKDIKVGDLIEVESPRAGQSILIYRDTVTHVGHSTITTEEWTFANAYNEGRTFYRLPRPAPEEPKGLGAVVQDSDGDLWVQTNRNPFPWATEHGDTSRWDTLLDNYGPVTVKSDGYTQ